MVQLLSLIAAFLVGFQAQADDRDYDDLVVKKRQLVAINNNADQMSKEIADLDRVSAERAQNIKALNIRIQAARRSLEQQQAELSKVRAQAAAVEKIESASKEQLATADAKLAEVNAQLTKIKDEYAKADAKHKSEMAKIDLEKKEELKKRAELNQRVANYENHLKKNSSTREQARESVDNVYKGNERLYEKLKGRQPSESAASTPPSE